MRRFLARVLLVCALVLAAGGLRAQVALPSSGGNSNQPVTFTADSVEYDRDRGLVIASGHVQAWQNDHYLSADRVTFDRNADVAAAAGHVVLVEPNGEVLFSDYAELGQGMREAVLKGMSALLAENGRLIANGARRTDGKLNELSRGVYSTCDLCAQDPTRAPLWQLRARSMVQDTEHKRIEYQDAWLDIYGLPLLYFPYFWHADPSVKRASGLLPPNIGVDGHIGAFVAQPYYWVLDDQSDLTLTPEVTTQAGEQLGVDYRRDFNDGRLRLDSALANYNGQFNGYVFSTGTFDIDQNWRAGFNINRATNATYLSRFRVPGSSDILSSTVYIEGFGEGSYTRLDSSIYQGLTTAYNQSDLPVVLPRYQYHYFGQPDALNGVSAIDVDAFNLTRGHGTNTRRAALTGNWDRPLTDGAGELWQASFHFDIAGYQATHLDEQPDYSTASRADTLRALPQVALEYRWPLLRDAGRWGAQIIEPIVQLILAPNPGNRYLRTTPNEDSLDLQFTDSNLFAWNKFPGIDRQEGGARANVGLRGEWNFAGEQIEGLIGQSYRVHKDDSFPIGSGLNNNASDVVGHVAYVPASWLDLTAQARVNNATFAPRFADVYATGGVPALRLSAGYVYETTNPFYAVNYPPYAQPPEVPRNELALGANSSFGRWRLGGYGRRDLARNEMVAAGAEGAYEDECFIFDIRFDRRFTSLDGDNGNTTVQFQITFKTVGQFGFHAF
jgi:LPS-assembly protein